MPISIGVWRKYPLSPATRSRRQTLPRWSLSILRPKLCVFWRSVSTPHSSVGTRTFRADLALEPSGPAPRQCRQKQWPKSRQKQPPKNASEQNVFVLGIRRELSTIRRPIIHPWEQMGFCPYNTKQLSPRSRPIIQLGCVSAERE